MICEGSEKALINPTSTHLFYLFLFFYSLNYMDAFFYCFS